MNAAPTPVTPQAAPLSEGARLMNTFFAPSKTFTDLRRRPGWWTPWLVVSFFALAFMFVVGQQIGFEQVARNQIHSSSRAERFDKLPPEQQARQLHVAAVFTKYIGYVFPVIILISFLLIAAVLMGTFNLGAGAEVGFGTALAIVAYGSLPGVLHAILSMISIFAGVDHESFNLSNPIATNPAYFMDPAVNRVLYGLAMGVDVFVIWNIVLIGIGFACNSKVKRANAIAMVAGWFVLYKLLAAGLTALFS